LYRGINDFKKVYQPISNIVKDEESDLFTGSHNILDRWRKYFSQLFIVYEVRQTDLHTAEPLVPDPSAFEVEMAILKKNKGQKSPGIDPNPAELITTGCRTIRSAIHKHFKSIWNKQELPMEGRESIILPIYKNSDKTDCSNHRDIFCISNI